MSLKTILFGEKRDMPSKITIGGESVDIFGQNEKTNQEANLKLNDKEGLNHEHIWEQSHDAFDSSSESVQGYRTHPDIPPFKLMNRHQFCKICEKERIFKIDAFTGRFIGELSPQEKKSWGLV